jgi:hypothetical protein
VADDKATDKPVPVDAELEAEPEVFTNVFSTPVIIEPIGLNEVMLDGAVATCEKLNLLLTNAASLANLR